MVKPCVHQPVFVLYGSLVPSGLRNPRHIPASDEHEWTRENYFLRNFDADAKQLHGPG